MNRINMPGGRGDYMDIPLHSLAFHVYPDLYYNIGLLKTNKTTQSFEKVNQYKDVFNLWHYYIGKLYIRSVISVFSYLIVNIGCILPNGE